MDNYGSIKLTTFEFPVSFDKEFTENDVEKIFEQIASQPHICGEYSHKDTLQTVMIDSVPIVCLGILETKCDEIKNFRFSHLVTTKFSEHCIDYSYGLGNDEYCGMITTGSVLHEFCRSDWNRPSGLIQRVTKEIIYTFGLMKFYRTVENDDHVLVCDDTRVAGTLFAKESEYVQAIDELVQVIANYTR
jgi:hypothetical protein